MKKSNRFFNKNSCESIISPDSSFPKFSPPKSIWEKVVNIRCFKDMNIKFGVKHMMTLFTKGYKIGNRIICFINIYVMGTKIIMSSTALTSSNVSSKCNFFVQIECSRIDFIRLLTSPTNKSMSRCSSIFKFAFTTFNKILSHRDNFNYNLLQSIGKGDC